MIEAIIVFIVWCVPGLIGASLIGWDSYKDSGYITLGDVTFLGFFGVMLGWLMVPIGFFIWITSLNIWSKKLFTRR